MNELTEAQPGTTHILIDYPNQQTTHLFRASTGIMVGMRVATKVQWGVNPANAETRVFMNVACAVAFLKQHVAAGDLTDCHIEAAEGVDVSVTAPIFEERNGEPMVEVPAPLLNKHRN